MASVNMRINATDLLTPICIEVPVVLDAFADSRDQALYTLELADIAPDTAVAPFVFEDAKASSLFGAVEDLVVTDLPNETIRVRANIVIPLTVSFYDANNVLTTATSSITIAEDVIMKQPQPSKFPYSTEALVSVSALEAVYNPNTGNFEVILCVYIIFKLIAEQTICINTRGNCNILPPNIFAPENSCENFFELPDFPAVDATDELCSVVTTA